MYVQRFPSDNKVRPVINKGKCIRLLTLIGRVKDESNSVTDWLVLYGVLLLSAGNDNLHLLTFDKRQRLRVDLADFEGNTSYAEYDNFTVGSAREKYRLVSLGTYNGTAGK